MERPRVQRTRVYDGLPCIPDTIRRPYLLLGSPSVCCVALAVTFVRSAVILLVTDVSVRTGRFRGTRGTKRRTQTMEYMQWCAPTPFLLPDIAVLTRNPFHSSHASQTLRRTQTVTERVEQVILNPSYNTAYGSAGLHSSHDWDLCV